MLLRPRAHLLGHIELHLMPTDPDDRLTCARAPRGGVFLVTLAPNSLEVIGIARQQSPLPRAKPCARSNCGAI